jgi:hypothetical protein
MIKNEKSQNLQKIFPLSAYGLSLHLKFINLISELFLTYSWWWLLAVVATGVVYALLLYFKNPLSRLSRAVSVFLFILRFLSVSMLAFLLLSPFLKTRIKIKEKPIIIVGVDNSRSIVLSADSAFYKNSFPEKMNKLLDVLEEDYQADFYTYGRNTRVGQPMDFTEVSSDYSNFFNTIQENYRGLNVGAVVLAGDGLYNRGSDPVYNASNLKWPVYTIALGDTTAYSDLKVNDVRYNRLVYLDDNFPVEVNIDAAKLKGKSAVLKLFAFGKLVEKKTFFIKNDHFSTDFRILVPATEKGKHRVKITLTVFDNELNKQNNSKSIFVNVLDSRQKVLIVAAAPHPDLSAIRQSLSGFRDYKVDIQFIKKLTADPSEYDLVIFHQVPSLKYNADAFFKSIIEKKIPTLFILGKQSNISRFNSYFDGLHIFTPHGFEMAQPVINPKFSVFNYDEVLTARLENLPPLTVPFGNYKPADRSKIMAWQKINNLETDIPLVLFYESDGVKQAVITGEGVWLWKMHDYLKNSNFDAVETLLGKTVQYLTARTDKRHFRILSREYYQPGEKVALKAELYNDAWELINNQDVTLTLINEHNEQFKYSFSPYEDYYTLNLDNLLPGVYQYKGKARNGDKVFSDKGEFVVNSVSVESRKLQADFNLMYRLASENRGKMIYPSQMDSLPDLIKENQNVKTRVIYNFKTDGLNNIWYILVLILFLLSLEWFLRKYFGSY